jgi:CheY-like chemotaxis protein
MAESGEFLVVEDDETVRQALGRLVRSYGEAAFACTAHEARELLAAGTRWSAFIFDIGLPDGCGLDVLAEARAVYPAVPAMVLTGSLAGADINTAYDLHANYVVKPVDASRLGRFLRAASKREVPRLSDAGQVPDTLPGCIEHLRVLFTAPRGVRARYAIGATVAAIKERTDLFGAGAVAVVAEALGEDVPSLYRHAAVAERLGASEVEDLLGRKGPGGRSLSWSHLVVLGSVESPAARERLVRRVLEEGLSVRGLTLAVGNAAMPGGVPAR